MDKIKYIKIEDENGNLSDNIPIGADASNIDTADGNNIENKILFAENDINLLKQKTNNLYNQIGEKISISPIAVNSIEDMTDPEQIYINLSDGYWYYYDNDTFVQGGIYQALEIEDNSITPDKININGYEKNKNIYNSDFFILQSHVGGYKNIDNIKYIDIVSNSTNSRKVIKFPLDNVTKICFLYPYNQSQAWGRAYQITDSDGRFINNEDKLYGNYSTIVTNQSSEFCTFNSESKIVTIDIENMRISYPNIKEIYISIYELSSWTLTCTATINYFYPIQNIEWINLDYLASKDYVKQNINTIPTIEKYDVYTKSNLYEICMYGDSLTENGNGSTSIVDYLRNKINNNKISILNFGKGGQSSGTIAWRQGGLIITTSQDAKIPASNEESVIVEISISSGNILNFVGVNTDLDCEVLNIPCKMSINTSNSTITLKRNDNGNAIDIPSGTVIHSTQEKYMKDTQIIWIGKNDIPNAGNYQITGVLSNIQSMINHLSPEIKRFIILSVITSTTQTIGTDQYNTIIDINNSLKQLYPNNYVDIQNYLVNNCIYDMNLVPTELDLQDIQNGTIPRQLLSDGVHPNPQCREYISNFIYNNLFDRGWIIK